MLVVRVVGHEDALAHPLPYRDVVRLCAFVFVLSPCCSFSSSWNHLCYPAWFLRFLRERDLHANLEVLLRFEEGEKLMQIAWALGLATSTVASVRVNKDKIHASSQAVTPVSVRQLTCCRGVVMGLTEHLLSPRIEEQKWQNPPLSMLLIQDRARRLFAQLQHEQGDG
ncbi:Cenpb Dna-Binding Domain-Containing Protein 1 [Manis pentadactyla]|nr:Cenpb Dna-Binding Domain-Containing Protein 1 [Manis pentadactyla]